MRTSTMNEQRNVTIAVGVILLIINLAISAFAWPYAINEWLLFFGKEASVVWWHGVLLGFVPVIGQAAIPAAAVTWILMLVI